MPVALDGVSVPLRPDACSSCEGETARMVGMGRLLRPRTMRARRPRGTWASDEADRETRLEERRVACR